VLGRIVQLSRGKLLSPKALRTPRLLRILAASAALAFSALAGYSANAEDPRHRSVGPFYNPYTKSYFEVRRDNTQLYWANAKKLAASRTHKGAHGRLAVINDAQTMEWINKTFQARDELWIGLTYWCKSRRMVWSSGEEHPHKAYSNWSPRRWYRTDGINCNDTDRLQYMPVSLKADNGRYYWQATGSAKGFIGYIVEYPTGKE
jgi:hypothetical protein